MSTADEIPAFAGLTFPPFPAKRGETSYSQWKTKGIWVPVDLSSGVARGDDRGTLSDAPAQGIDSHGKPLVDINTPPSGSGVASTTAPTRPRKLGRGMGGILRLPVEDCFKLGQEGSEWIEPDETGRPEEYGISRAPFDRLISATRDFLQSRHEAFEFNRTKRLFDSLRYTFGLRTELPGRHWPGSGDNAQEYQPPRSAMRAEADMETGQMPTDEEVCVLLRNPESSVRGFIALIRRDTEAGWDMGPTFKLAELTASFFAYIDHYKVFTDEPYASQFHLAAQLASQAPRRVRDANTLEVTLASGDGINQLLWRNYGGQYGTAGRGTQVDDGEPWLAQKEVNRKTVLSGQDAKQVPVSQLPSLLHPVEADSVQLLGHIPYARRRIVKVLPPTTDTSRIAFQENLYCLITVPAPWTDAEGWRRLSTDVRYDEDNFVNPLEGEATTIDEPAELTLWVEAEAIPDSQVDRLVGMGLRGRWGLFGADRDQAWWAFSAKDYVLPALWYKADAK